MSQNEASVCFICLENNTPPVESGCACLGGTQWVHVDCIVKTAEHGYEDALWYQCQICKTRFRGDVQAALAAQWVSNTSERPESDEERMCAQLNLANTFFETRTFREAYKINKDLLLMQIRVFGNDNMHTLITQSNIARIYLEDNKFDIGMEMLSHVFEIQKKTIGENDIYTLLTENEIHCRNALMNFEKGLYAEAEKNQNRLVQVTDLLFGHDNIQSLRNETIRGFCLFRHGKKKDALQIQRDVLKRQMLSLGCDHRETKHSTRLLQLYANDSNSLMQYTMLTLFHQLL